jgi:hypothetical protein
MQVPQEHLSLQAQLALQLPPHQLEQLEQQPTQAVLDQLLLPLLLEQQELLQMLAVLLLLQIQLILILL